MTETIRVNLDRLQATIGRVRGAAGTVKAVVRDTDGRIVGLAERPISDDAALADALRQVDAIVPLIKSATEREQYAVAVSLIALSEAAERHADPPTRAAWRVRGDAVRDLLRQSGIVLEPWYA